MLVRDRMSSPVITVTQETPFQEALQIMRERKFRRLPIVDKQQRLIGIVAERDLLHASPSPATSLSVWEMNYLLWKLKIGDIMTTRVVSVSPDIPIEEAAKLMVEHRIGGLPVVDERQHVVGVITETDIFKAFVSILGSERHGLRIVMEVPPGKGTLAKLAQVIANLDGNIVSVGSIGDGSDEPTQLLVKVQGVGKEQLLAAIESLGDHVVDAREVVGGASGPDSGRDPPQQHLSQFFVL